MGVKTGRVSAAAKQIGVQMEKQRVRRRLEGRHVSIFTASVAAAGLAIYLYIPQYKLISGATIGLILVIVLKHVGPFAMIGAPTTILLRKCVALYSHHKGRGDR